jgi:hypothetical protein
MSAPLVQLLLGFGTTPALSNYFTLDRDRLDNTSNLLGPDTVMVDVSQWLYGGLSIVRGRSREVDAYQAGTASFVLHNEDRRFDPTNTASPYYPGVLPRAPVSIYIAGRQVFGGHVDTYDVIYRKPNIVDLHVAALDGFSMLSNTKLSGAVFGQELSGSRIHDVIVRPEVNWTGAFYADNGLMLMQGSTQDQVPALDHCHAITASEAGWFFVDGAGALNFHDKSWLSRQLASNPNGVVTFTDTGVAYAGLAIGYVDITLSTGSVLLFNRCEASRSGGYKMTADDITSQAHYGLRTLSLPQLENVSDGDVLSICGVMVDRYKQPEVRFSTLVVEMSGLSLAQQQLLSSLDLGTVVTAERTPPGVGTPPKITQISSIEHMDWSLDVGASSYRLTLGLRNISTMAGLLMDSASLGVLDTAKLG